MVLECTGRFRSRADAAGHLDAGARKVIVSAPMKDPDATVVLGVNFDEATTPTHRSCRMPRARRTASRPSPRCCTRAVGIRHGQMTTIHAYTADQRLVDLPHKDLRRARAAAINLVPTSTGAAKAIGLVIPELAGKLHGFAVRVPIPTGSIVDLTIEAIPYDHCRGDQRRLREHADAGALEGILAYSEEPLVSTDVVASPYSAVFDAPLTSVVEGTQVKVIAWYDNEWGYSNRLVELATKVLVEQPVLAR